MLANVTELGREFAGTADEILTRERTRSPADPEKLWQALVEAGWFELLLDDEHGGLGLGIEDLAGIFVVAGRHLVAAPLLEHTVVVPLLLNHVDASVGARLEPLAAGRQRAAFVDPEAAGAGAPVRFAADADQLVVVTESGVAIVPAHDRGVTITPVKSYDPISTFAHVTMGDGAGLEPLLDGPRAVACLDAVRGAARFMIACELAGVTRELLDASVTYAKDREQFGKPIGAFQAVQHLLADMCVSVLALEAACSHITTNRGVIATEAAVVKALAAAAARTVAEGALQVHGGIAFTEEYELRRWFEHAIALQGLYGDAHDLSRLLGATVLRGELALA
jgi:alkylation response protein AidB-like acyl-CoA dehydrogenase